jgi:hypothetical protein
MGQYAILLRDDFGMQALPPDEQERVFQRFIDWSESLFQSGQHAGVERLEREGVTVRVRDGRPVIDGPYAEGKEAVMGFFLVEAESLEAAAKIAAGVPSVSLGGAIEVRPVAPFPKPGDPARG